MKNKFILTLLALLIATPLWAQVPERSRLVNPSVTSLSWVRGTGTSCATPMFSSTADTDTGVCFPSDNQVGVGTAGSQRLRVSDIGITLAPSTYLNFEGTLNSAPDVSLRRVGAGEFAFELSGARYFLFRPNTDGMTLRSTSPIGWSSGNPGVDAADAFIVRDSGATVALKDGTNAQTFKIYASTGNNQRIEFISQQSPAASVVRTNWSGGAGSALILGAGNSHWMITTAGNFVAVDDAVYDIGASGATRPRSIYTASHVISGGDVSVGASNYLYWPGKAQALSPVDGVVMWQNSAGTDFTRLILGTNDASGSAIRNDGAQVSFVTGNAGSYISALAANFKAQTSFTSPLTTGTLVTNDAQTVANDGVLAIGSNALIGQFQVLSAEDGDGCTFYLRGTNNATVEMSDSSGSLCSNASGTASSINVYYDSGYKLENKRGGSRNIRIIRLGV